MDLLEHPAELADGGHWMSPLVVPAASVKVDDALRERIDDAMGCSCSARHLPDEIEASAVPHTLTGKRLEVPVKRLLKGMPPARAVNAGVVDRPDVLDFFVRPGQERHANRGNE
jgi:acetoacetyl-CoA synthetase